VTVKRLSPKYCHKHRSTSKKAAMGLLLSLVLRTNYDVDVVDVSVNSGPHPETHTYELVDRLYIFQPSWHIPVEIVATKRDTCRAKSFREFRIAYLLHFHVCQLPNIGPPLRASSDKFVFIFSIKNRL